jgi:drug/metabolite transporter (DMT)-like permease
MKNKNPRILAYLLLVIGIICIGFSAIFVRLSNVPGSVSAFYRSFIAVSIIIPIWLKSSLQYPPIKDLVMISIGGLLFALDIILWNSGVMLTSATTAAILANNAPIWVGLGTLFFFKEKLSYRFWLGLTVSIIGMILLVGVEALRNLKFNLGDLLAFSASIFYAGYLLITQQIRKRVDTFTFTTFFMVSCAVTTFFFNLFLNNPFGGFTTNTWLSLLGLGIISHLGGWLTINYALGHIKAAYASVTLLGQAVVTAIIAMPLLNEFMNLNQIGGGTLVLLGIYFVNYKKT